MKTFATRSIDVAAFLYLKGFTPVDAVMSLKWRVREFRYRVTPKLRSTVIDFDAGAPVPAKAFAEARATMKTWGGTRQAARNFQHAVEDVVRQVAYASGPVVRVRD